MIKTDTTHKSREQSERKTLVGAKWENNALTGGTKAIGHKGRQTRKTVMAVTKGKMTLQHFFGHLLPFKPGAITPLSS